jgi:tryptophan-rich sensory protein
LKFASIFYVAMSQVAILSAFVFHEYDKVAGFMFTPYIVWLIFMALVHYDLYEKNPGGKWFYNEDLSLKIHNITR